MLLQDFMDGKELFYPKIFYINLYINHMKISFSSMYQSMQIVKQKRMYI